MGFLKKIVDALFGSAEGEMRDKEGIYLYIKCDRCGAPVQVRVDKRHDLQRDYDSGGYVLRKEIMDGTCFSLMQATVRFDPGYRVVEREIEGGEFITYEEFRALTKPQVEREELTEEA
ncbi:MAG: hypothetical protein ACP5HG_09970 [Anaerolineae bacterium]